MPHYYFDTRDNENFVPDEIGLEITSFEKVKAVASAAMADLARDVLPGSLVRDLRIEVRDDSGPVLRVTLRFEVEHALDGTHQRRGAN
ncbi:DUF6894 family protein [Bradyrhizobium sp. Lot33]